MLSLFLASGLALCAGEASAALTINYRSIGGSGTQTGTATVTNGSATVDGIAGSNWITNNRGHGDRITFDGGTSYQTVLSVDSETRLRLTAPYGGTGGSKTYTIGRKFTTMQTWTACIDKSGGAGACGAWDPVVASTSLVADQRIEVGIVYKDLANPQTGIIQIGTGTGSALLTTSALYYIMLTADVGNRHKRRRGRGRSLRHSRRQQQRQPVRRDPDRGELHQGPVAGDQERHR